jgi:SAM-dependent methyltransferase
VTVLLDYDATPERYRLGMQVTKANSVGSLYNRIASMLTELEVGTVLDVGCGEGALREALPVPGARLVGLDVSMTLLRAHPPPVVQADATRLPFALGAFDAVAASERPLPPA